MKEPIVLEKLYNKIDFILKPTGDKSDITNDEIEKIKQSFKYVRELNRHVDSIRKYYEQIKKKIKTVCEILDNQPDDTLYNEVILKLENDLVKNTSKFSEENFEEKLTEYSIKNKIFLFEYIFNQRNDVITILRDLLSDNLKIFNSISDYILKYIRTLSEYSKIADLNSFQKIQLKNKFSEIIKDINSIYNKTNKSCIDYPRILLKVIGLMAPESVLEKTLDIYSEINDPGEYSHSTIVSICSFLPVLEQRVNYIAKIDKLMECFLTVIDLIFLDDYIEMYTTTNNRFMKYIEQYSSQ